MMKITIGNGAIELDGQGGGVTVQEIKRVRTAFRKLFGVQPRIRMSGRFGRDAMGPITGADQNVDVWDLRQGTGTGYVEVIHVGPEFLNVLPFTGLNNNRSIPLSPERGTLVKFRFLVPNPDLEECPKCGGTWTKGAPVQAQNHRGNCRG